MGRDKSLADMTLYVPAGTKAAYKAAAVWQEFGTIIEEGIVTGIATPHTEAIAVAATENGIEVGGVPEGTPIAIYNLKGELLQVSNTNSIELPSGLYLLRVANTTLKVAL